MVHPSAKLPVSSRPPTFDCPRPVQSHFTPLGNGDVSGAGGGGVSDPGASGAADKWSVHSSGGPRLRLEIHRQIPR